MNVLSGCSGIGGLDLGFKAAGYRTVCYIEYEPYPQSVLLDRMREGLLDTAPIWNDFKTFDGKPWRGVVDLFVAGIPCQPHSHAGKRRGESDDRDLWPDMRRITSEVEPRVVVVENVPGLFSGPQAYGFRIIGELQRMGYVVVKRTLSAAECGAPHLRHRVFIIGVLASDDQSGRGSIYGDGVESARSVGEALERVGRCSQTEPSDSESERCGGWSDENGVLEGWSDGSQVRDRRRVWCESSGFGEDTRSYAEPSDSDGGDVEAHRKSGVRSYLRRAGQDEHTPSVEGSKSESPYALGNGIQRSSEGSVQRLPDFKAFENVRSPEELFGRSDIPEPLIRRGDDGLPHRLDRLKGIGNAVVPQVSFQIAFEIKKIME